MLSCVLIIPEELQAKANSLAEYMGWGPDNYSVALTSSSQGPASHYGLHAWVQQSFVEVLEGAENGVMPQELIDAGYAEDDFLEVASSVVSSIRENAEGHFDEAATGLGLQRLPDA